MSSNAILTQGTRFAVSTEESPPNYQFIPEIRTIGGPDGSAPLIDVTDLDSTAREFKLGLKDEGAFSLQLMYIPGNTVHALLRNAWSNRTTLWFRITYTDGTLWEFEGIVQNMSGNINLDSVVESNVTIKVSGSIAEY